MKTKIFIALLAIGTVFLLPNTSFAQSDNASPRAQGHVKKEDRNNERPMIRTVTGTVTAISSSTISMLANNINYTVDPSDAIIVRRFGASMTLSDIQVNDRLAVQGRIDGTTIKSLFIRDLSLQAYNGEFSGEVLSLNTTDGHLVSFVLKSRNRGEQTINITSSTTFKKNNQPATPTDLSVGSTVRVSGVWNRTNENVTAKVINITARLHSIEIHGIVAGVADTTITVTGKNGRTYTVLASNTMIVHEDYSPAVLGDVRTGDKIVVHAIQLNDSLSVKAYLVRDLTR